MILSQRMEVFVVVICDKSGVRDSNLVGIASKIFDCIDKSVECLFDIRAPVFLIEGVFKGVPAKGCL